MRFADVACGLFRLHHHGALVGERSLFRRDRCQSLEFLHGVPEKIGFPLRALDFGAMRRDLASANTALMPKPGNLLCLRFESAKRIEQAPMRGRIHQRALVVLAMDLDQGYSQRLQRLRAERLIIGEGARAAIGKLHAPQNELVFSRKFVLRHQRAHRVCRRQLERRRHLPVLCALTHQRSVAARPERKREGVEQDRFPCARLTREHREAGGKFDIKPVDQDDVTNREPGQHCPCLPFGR